MAVADPGTNSVLVVASPDNQEKIARDIIDALDGDDTNRLETMTRKINFSDAQTSGRLVNSVLSNQRPGAGFFHQSVLPAAHVRRRWVRRLAGSAASAAAAGGGSTGSTDPFGKVVADPRTNTLLITASKDRLVRINDLIDKLDQEVPSRARRRSCFPLKNAQVHGCLLGLGAGVRNDQQ